jgi:hypothetical protein
MLRHFGGERSGFLVHSRRISGNSEIIRELSWEGGCAIRSAAHCQSDSGGISRCSSKRERGFCVHNSIFENAITDWLIGVPAFFLMFIFVYFPFTDRDRISIKKWKIENDDYCFFF